MLIRAYKSIKIIVKSISWCGIKSLQIVTQNSGFFLSKYKTSEWFGAIASSAVGHAWPALLQELIHF